MRLAIDHTLTLSLPPETAQAVLHLLLTPGTGPGQNVESWSVEVAGIGNAGRFTDAYGNMVHLVNQARPEGDITLAARGVVVTSDINGVLGKPGREPVPALYKRITALTKAPVTVYGKFRTAKESRLDVLHGLMARVGETLGLPEAAEPQTQMQANGAQSQSQAAAPAEALPPPADYAHLFVGAARALDIPARFITGYLAPDKHHAGGLHAWAEAYDEGLGWIGFDPALQMCPTDRHVRLVVGLDGESATPLRTVPVGELVQTVTVKAG
ncbi:MAG: transglutaminase domain-containing protein [Devosia sp.]|uniref:transglutaminase family protein n=1 Tax=Devosia sp. TaxID=1871048 RepID=UPI0024C70F0A|nr:transglutaminase domain-containing protein [Devosia sp.]UYN99449.1 MAG: transglutaminase domain-containing protein [Devosia sp.]